MFGRASDNVLIFLKSEKGGENLNVISSTIEFLMNFCSISKPRSELEIQNSICFNVGLVNMASKNPLGITTFTVVTANLNEMLLKEFNDIISFFTLSKSSGGHTSKQMTWEGLYSKRANFSKSSTLILLISISRLIAQWPGVEVSLPPAWRDSNFLKLLMIFKIEGKFSM